MKPATNTKSPQRLLPPIIKKALVQFNHRLLLLANYLQQKTNGYSTRKKKLLLLLFVFVFVAGCTIVIARSMKPKPGNQVPVTRIKTILIQKNAESAPTISRAMFLKVQDFKNRMDRLSTTTEGKKIRDSLLCNRPQLLDSIEILINLYLKQSKTILK